MWGKKISPECRTHRLLSDPFPCFPAVQHTAVCPLVVSFLGSTLSAPSLAQTQPVDPLSKLMETALDTAHVVRPQEGLHGPWHPNP